MKNKGKGLWAIHSIRTRFLLITLMIAVVTTLVSLAISYYTEIDTIKKTTESYMTQYISFADRRFNEMLEEARKISLSVATEQEIIYPGMDGEKSDASYAGYQQRKQIKSYLNGLMSQKQYIENILVVTQDARIFQANSGLMMKKDLQEPVMKEAQTAQRAGIRYDRKAQEVLYCCPIIRAGKRVAVSMIRLNYEALTEAYRQEPLQAVRIFIYDPDGNLFYSNTEGQGQETELLDKISGKEGASGYTDWNGERQYFISYGAEDGKMTTVSLIPYELLLRDANKLRSRFLLIGIGAVLLAAAASIYLSGRLCANLRKLTDSMEEIRTGNLMVHSDVHSQDEIGMLSVAFNEMMERIRNLLEEIRQKEKLKAEAEQTVLATQIEPHFLYNSIDSIQHVAHMRHEEEIEQVALALSELLRSVLSNRNEFITLWEEREYIENYTTIERFKYRGNFQLIWDVDEELWTYRLPKLLLQPVVENAVIHGIAAKENDGIIQVKVYRQEQDIIVKIMDNGKGMSQEETDRLLNEIRRSDKAGFRRVGLSNVFGRIRLIYGEEYGGTIYSYRSMFTCVELKLPAFPKG